MHLITETMPEMRLFNFQGEKASLPLVRAVVGEDTHGRGNLT